MGLVLSPSVYAAAAEYVGLVPVRWSDQDDWYADDGASPC